ncbi:MAG TPA: transcriptional regulator NrdR, partial [Polaromonas sp.]|nr:transcriptional regulator NrdR [Polaromonas sp.]
IGELVMRELKKLDKVAYIRFASVYRSFEDIDEFRALVDEVRR